MTGPRVDEEPYCCRSCASPLRDGHLDDCPVLAERVNRVAAVRSLLFGGVFQNPELMLSGLERRR